MDSILSVPQAKQKRQLVVTKTGEPYQPIRVYFQVSNYKTLLRAFDKLNCVAWEDLPQRWIWLYEQETRKLRFDISYKDIAKVDRPLILAEMTFPSQSEMYFDARSVDRALYGIEFFSKRINWRVAKATRLRIVNHFFSVEQVKQQPLHEYYGDFFDRADVKIPDPVALTAKLDEIEATHADSDERIAAIDAYFAEEAKQPLAEVEEIEIDFQDFGMMPITMALKMRQIEAFERWHGNTSINQLEIMQRFMEWDEIENGEADDPSSENPSEL
jgi:hypothetical protein